MNARDFFPWASQKILNGETVIIPNRADLRQKQAAMRASAHTVPSPARMLGSQWEKGEVFGLLGFAVVREGRARESIVNGFKLVAQVFANALARKGTERALVESESRLSIGDKCRGSGPLEHGA